jgi:hypothetical protein
MRKGWLVLVGGCAAAALVVAGCGGSSEHAAASKSPSIVTCGRLTTNVRPVETFLVRASGFDCGHARRTALEIVNGNYDTFVLTCNSVTVATERSSGRLLALPYAAVCTVNPQPTRWIGVRARPTSAQLRANALVKSQIIGAKRGPEARRRAEEAKREAERRARIAAANAWHQGYYQQDGNVFWRWRNGLSCTEYAAGGCWHVEVVTRNGCQSYVTVHANEYQNGAMVKGLRDNQVFGIPPEMPRIFELDSDVTGQATANNVRVECE